MQETWVGKIPQRKERLPTPVLLPRESHGWRSLVGYSPWGRKESDTTERLHSLPMQRNTKLGFPRAGFKVLDSLLGGLEGSP